MRIYYGHLPILLLTTLAACSSLQFSENWVWGETGESMSATLKLRDQFDRDSRACVGQANAIEGGPGGLPQEQEPDNYLSWDSEYASCLRAAGWKLR
jgi:hypothetical protein